MDADTSSRTARARRLQRRQHVEMTAFLYTIVDVAECLKTALDFGGSPALRFDARWTLLRAIERGGGCPSFSDIARMLRITRQSARALALAAAKAGDVELFPDPYDRRALQVALTPRGRQALERHRLPELSWILTLLNGLEPARMRSMAHVLNVMARRLRRYETDLQRAALHLRLRPARRPGARRWSARS